MSSEDPSTSWSSETLCSREIKEQFQFSMGSRRESNSPGVPLEEEVELSGGRLCRRPKSNVCDGQSWEEQEHKYLLGLYSEAAVGSCRHTVMSGRHSFIFTFIPVVYGCNFVIGVIGNSMVVAVIRRYIKLKTVANVFVLNLAISDLTFLITLPLWATFTATGYHWPFGTFLCKASAGLVIFNLYTSVFFLAALSIDRYLAIVHPVRSRRQRTLSYANFTCMLIWLFALLLSAPTAISRDVYDLGNVTLCAVWHRSEQISVLVALSLLKAVLGFLVPFLVISTCYCLIGRALLESRDLLRKSIRSREDETLRMIAATVLAFFVCWAPHQAFHFMELLAMLGVVENCQVLDVIDTAMPFTICISYLNSCVNPILYGDKVLRLKPANDDQVKVIKGLGQNVQLNFWKPDSGDLVSVGMNVDIQVPAAQLSMVFTLLQQNDMEVIILFENLQEAVEAQTNKRATKAHDYTKYNNWATISEWAVSIGSSNPELISRQEIGKSYEGRPMHLLKVGKNTGSVKPAVFMDCGFHAREWITPAFCQWFVKEALSTYGSDADMTNLLNKMDFFVLPVFNIDGYEYTWTKDRMWRKTRSKNSGSSCIGADPNRNFNAGWCSTGASSNPCSDTYCGSSPESEIEAKNLANFIRSNKSIIKSYLTVHSYSQLLLFPYSYKYGLAADHSELLSVAQGATSALRSLYGTKYTSGPGATTICRYGFLLPESQIKPTCEETMLAVKFIANHVLNNLY
ncbi:hypothetical protein DNTS_004910 [Danionella cerebrum]|uniref:Type-1 angiotensin II receptor n=1 Tax=Danionella cerebrum TaxID=2873325 RepID=A0A553MZ80_9TELE|nr:hypothetical protein DNTS_004910 [Danionella translucida]